MSTFDGASAHDLLTEWATWATQDEVIWQQEWATLAERGQSLACNDPFIAALVRAHLLGTLGPVGLRSTSLYDDQREESETSDAAKALRRKLTAITDRTWMGSDLDAEGVRSRMELELALAWSAFVKGDGFAVRVQRRGRSTWRLVDPRRVRNPEGKQNSDRMRDGFTFDADGVVDGILVSRAKINGNGLVEYEEPRPVPWRAPDGTPNVIHRVGLRLPGMIRGVSRLAPMIVLSRQIHGVLESHVAAKRLQAVHAMIVEAADPKAWKDAMANGTALGSPKWNVRGPLNVWVKPSGSGDVQFTDPKFNGLDLEAYLKMVYKVQCAAEQVPVDVVLCQMGEASLSSARAGLDQFDRTCQADQERHIGECSSNVDEVAILDASVRGEVALPAAAGPDLFAAKYSRPPKYSTDRLKDAETITALRAAGVSGTTSFAMFGLVYEDEREIVAAEKEFESAQSDDEQPDDADDEAGANEQEEQDEPLGLICRA